MTPRSTAAIALGWGAASGAGWSRRGREAVDAGHQQDHGRGRGRREHRADEVRDLDPARRGAEPVADLVLRDERAGHRQRRADDPADQQHLQHPALAVQARARRATTAVTIRVVSVIPEIGVIEIIAIAQAETAANRKAIKQRQAGGDGREARRARLAGEHREAEVQEDQQARGHDAEQDERHRQAALGPARPRRRRRVPRSEPRELAERAACRLHDHRRHLEDGQDAGGEDAADADRAHVVEEDVLGAAWTRAARAAGGMAPARAARCRRRAAPGRRTTPCEPAMMMAA